MTSSENRPIFEKGQVEMNDGRAMGMVYGFPEKLEGNPTCFIIAHGAGGPMFSPFITYFHTELAKQGFLAVKFNFPYMQARKKFPDRSEVLKASYSKIVDEVKSSKFKPGRMLIGGKSMGGRIASMIAADGAQVDGLFFLGYPLHSPGRLDKLRDEHLYKISKPMLFVSGTNDAFGTRDLLAKVIAKLGRRAHVHWVEGGDHSFKTRLGKEGLAVTYQEVLSVLVDWANQLGSQ